VAAALTFAPLCLQSADWPQFLGPQRNGTYDGADLAPAWPKDGPRTVWQKRVGQGFSGPVVDGGKLILFHREGDQETVECLDAATGEALWKTGYASDYRDDFGFDEGPRSTPAIGLGKVYTFGAHGVMQCLELASGRKLWRRDLRQEFNAGKGFFGMACSPLLEGRAVLLNLGGANGAGIVALDRDTGELLWKTSDDEASYSSPVAATVGRERLAFVLSRSALVVLDPATGRIRGTHPFRPRMSASVSAATPLVIGNKVFLSASYDVGAALLEVANGKPKELWATDDAISSHYSTSVHHDGFVYGFHGRQETGQSFRCVELASGKVRWSKDSVPAGTVTLAGTDLLLLLEDGRLWRVEATSAEFRSKAQAQILPFGVRAYPALANGFLYARSKQQLVCVDIGSR
jgi:outer membrane protein assembly factor BamB